MVHGTLAHMATCSADHDDCIRGDQYEGQVDDMPSKPLRPCNHYGCNQLVVSGYCEQHKKDKQTYDRYRGSSAERGYGARHRRIREVVRREEPLCMECLKSGQVTPSNEMDHIDGNALNTERTNLQMLCKACHSRKTIREQGGFKGKKTTQ